MYNNYSNVYFFPEECMELDLYRENIKKLDGKSILAIISYELSKKGVQATMELAGFLGPENMNKLDEYDVLRMLTVKSKES